MNHWHHCKRNPLQSFAFISTVFWRGGVSRNVLSQEVDLWPRHLKSFKVQTEHFNYFDLWTFFPDKNCLENGEPDTSTMKLGDPAFTKHLVRTKQREKKTHQKPIQAVIKLLRRNSSEIPLVLKNVKKWLFKINLIKVSFFRILKEKLGEKKHDCDDTDGYNQSSSWYCI